MATHKFTQKWLNGLPMAEEGKQLLYWDTDAPGFGLKVGVTKKTFVIKGKVEGGAVRVLKVGLFGHLTLIEAKTKAQAMLGDMAKGIDRQAEKKQEKVKAKSLEVLLNEYLAARHLTENTRKDYAKAVEVSGWKGKAWQSITGEMVVSKFNELTTAGPTTANRHFRSLRAILQFGIDQVAFAGGTPPQNPCTALKKRWNPTKPKTTTIKTHHLANWYQAVCQLKNQTAQDFLVFTLLTGLRLTESASLPWKHVDLEGKTITIPNPKNHVPFTLPIGEHVHALLLRRWEQSPNSLFVFSSDRSTIGHYIEPKTAYKAVASKCGLYLTPHDLRRTLATIAAPLVSHAEVKAMLNHTPGNDVTLKHYAHIGTEELRQPVQLVNDFILTAMGAKEPYQPKTWLGRMKSGAS